MLKWETQSCSQARVDWRGLAAITRAIGKRVVFNRAARFLAGYRAHQGKATLFWRDIPVPITRHQKFVYETISIEELTAGG